MINEAYQIFSNKLSSNKTECLTEPEGTAFGYTGDVETDLLNIISVHPMRKDAVKQFLEKANAEWSTVENMLSNGRIIRIEYEKKTYYMKRLASRMINSDGEQC